MRVKDGDAESRISSHGQFMSNMVLVNRTGPNLLLNHGCYVVVMLWLLPKCIGAVRTFCRSLDIKKDTIISTIMVVKTAQTLQPMVAYES